MSLDCRCDSMHENGNCTAVGGFCTAVPAAHCPLIPELLARAETAEARCKRLEEARENANEAAAKWEGMYHMAEARAEKAERERDAAISDLTYIARTYPVDLCDDLVCQYSRCPLPGVQALPRAPDEEIREPDLPLHQNGQVRHGLPG